jgi:hypothetical protein
MTSKKIIREPGSGKTRDLMTLCAENGATLVCRNPEAMLVKAHAYGCNINIISYLDFLQTSEFNQNNAYLDDIDEFLEIIGCNVLGFGGNL